MSDDQNDQNSSQKKEGARERRHEDTAMQVFESEIENACDELSLVIKAFHRIESRIEEALTIALPAPHRLELRRMSMILKVDILTALGFMNPRLRPLFNKLNAIRNAYAHDPYKTFDQEEFLKLKEFFKTNPPGVDDAAASDPATSLKTLLTMAYFFSYLAAESALKSAATSLMLRLYHEERKRGRTMAQSNKLVEQELRDFLAKSHSDFDPEPIVEEIMGNRLNRSGPSPS